VRDEVWVVLVAGRLLALDGLGRAVSLNAQAGRACLAAFST
jgi:hypothetical protein